MDANHCDKDVFEKGTAVLVTDIPKQAANDIASAFSTLTGYRIDWHYVAGRVVFKALPPVVDLMPPMLVEGQSTSKNL